MQAIQGDHVWLEPEQKGEFSVAIGATVIGTDSGQIQLLDDDGHEHWVDGGQVLRHMHVTSVDGVQDMISLGDFSEAGILRNLFKRYNENQIYTYTGTILISVNPYKDLPIYDQDQIERYKDKKIGELPPHIFAIADNAYSSMQNSKQDQCIIISGESGSGKSECTKFILQYLASVSGQQSPIEHQILQAYPILEAFGNAKTIQNDNSSRFGKYIDIHFDDKGVIEDAMIEQYLLEKSRIVSQRKGERNYHIFYCMLAGLTAEGKAMFELDRAEEFDYLLQGQKTVCDVRDDEQEFDKIRSAMKVLMFDDEDIVNILKILSALLHIGNVRFNEFELDNIEASEIEDVTGINITANFLEVDPQALIDALTTKTIFAKDECVTYTMKKMQAMDVRDAFAKGIYGRLFVWIVKKINAAIYKPQQYHNKKSVKVLDIFSFENFDKNSFEQLCINYAIESLQQFFVTHVFKLEQAEYNNEGINWKNIEFGDNQGVLDLIADKPMNILSLMDEESKFPKGTDESMLNKLHFYHSNNQYYLKPKAAVTQTFGLKHFAGHVIYDCNGFLEKNRDTFSSDLAQLIQTSKSDFIKMLFTLDITETDARKKVTTLATKFKKSLEQLMSTLNVCHPFFVRCIKPNELKKPQVFNRELCCKQLRYLGMMETIRIRRAGYPLRHRYSEFVNRYRILMKGQGPALKGDSKSTAGKICSTLLNTTDFRLGKTKLFLKCFGLLGVNGAGKTTTFRMLTGDIVPESGIITLKGKRNFKQDIGYCPQEGGLDEYLTAEEMLYFHARLRGFNLAQTKPLVTELLDQLSLTQYAQKAVHTYSGGTKRKLSLAIALLGNPSILYLDEPTTGMDASTRRLAWNCLMKAKKNGQSIVLTSHSMDECDSLCSVIAIMVNGEIKCIGSPQHLKNKFGDGYTIIMHTRKGNLEAIINDFACKFPGTVIKANHHSSVELHVPKSSCIIADILTILQAAQNDEAIGYYSLSQTTLDSIFISFAEDQMENIQEQLILSATSTDSSVDTASVSASHSTVTEDLNDSFVDAVSSSSASQKSPTMRNKSVDSSQPGNPYIKDPTTMKLVPAIFHNQRNYVQNIQINNTVKSTDTV